MKFKIYNSSVKQAVNYEMSKGDTRVTMTTCMPKNIGAYLEENENIWNILRFKLKSAINQYFNRLWVEQTPAGTYQLFKNKLGLEDYLVDISCRHRVTYTKFRL